MSEKEEISESEWLMFGNCARCIFHHPTYDGGWCEIIDEGCVKNIKSDLISTRNKIRHKRKLVNDINDEGTRIWLLKKETKNIKLLGEEYKVLYDKLYKFYERKVKQLVKELNEDYYKGKIRKLIYEWDDVILQLSYI